MTIIQDPVAISDRRIHASVSIPVGDMRLRQRALKLLSVITATAVIVANPPKAIISKLLEIPFTVAGLASIDFAIFHVGHGWGWLAIGMSLMFAEYIVSDNTDDGG